MSAWLLISSTLHPTKTPHQQNPCNQRAIHTGHSGTDAFLSLWLNSRGSFWIKTIFYSPTEPVARCLEVLRDAATLLIHKAHTVLRLSVAFVRRFEKITGGFGVILRHAPALGRHYTEPVLRARVALRGGLAIPLRHNRGVLLRSKVFFVQPAQSVLGLGVAASGERKPYGMRTGIVAGTRRR